MNFSNSKTYLDPPLLISKDLLKLLCDQKFFLLKMFLCLYTVEFSIKVH